MTKQEANIEMKKLWKNKVRNRISENPFSEEAIAAYGIKLVKREIFHAKKEFSVIWDVLKQTWVVNHIESGVVAC